MTAVERKVKKLSEALERAKQAAQIFADSEDGGACNFDAPKIFLKGWSDKSVDLACKNAGLIMFPHRWCNGSPKGYVICGGTRGQGNRRSRMAEAMTEQLIKEGYDCVTYAECD